MEFLITILPVIFLHLFGLFDAMQTARKDYPYTDNLIWDYIQKQGSDYVNWYKGGNHIYPPGNPFKCDFWHWAKFMWTFCISGALLSMMLAMQLYPSYWLLIIAIFGYGIEGFSFNFYYSYVFRKDRDYKWYLKNILRGWQTHKP